MAVKGNLRRTIDKLQTKSLAMQTGEFVLTIAPLINSSIQQRVQNKGQGLTSGLKKYQNRYATYRQKKGRQTNYRDLTFTGSMWASLTYQKVGNAARLFFSGAEDARKAAYNHARQKFFGLSANEKLIIKEQLKKFSKL